jgi:hypothetical protein
MTELEEKVEIYQSALFIVLAWGSLGWVLWMVC